MSKYFKDVKSFTDLDNQYHSLLANYASKGDKEVLKAIDEEYDLIHAELNQSSDNDQLSETGEGSQPKFYTQHGWSGKRYDSALTTKEICARVREYVKTQWPQWKFHVKRETYAGGATIHLELAGGPCPCPILSDDEYHRKWGVSFSFSQEPDPDFTELVNKVMHDAVAYLSSYRYDDSDGTVDYFSTNFYTECKVLGSEGWTEIHKMPSVRKERKPRQATVETKTVNAPKTLEIGEITDEMRYIAERTVLKSRIRDLKRQLRALDKKYAK